MPINARDCYTTFGDIEKCDGVSSGNLTLVGIVGSPPFARERGRGKTLLEQFGSKSNHDHTPMNPDERMNPEPPKPENTETPSQKTEPPAQDSQFRAQNSQQRAPGLELGLPELELEQPGPLKQSKPDMDKLPPIGRLPRGFEQFEVPTRLKPTETKEDKQVNDLVQLLPDHPIRALSKSLLKGLLSGEFNRQEISSAMQEFAKAIKNQDITNLPPISSNDFPLGDASEMSLRLRKSSFAFNDALKAYGLKLEVIDGRGIVIHNRNNYQPVNIGVKLSGEIIAFQGKLERPDFKPMLVQDAVAELKSRLAPP